jgi:hypothetical protein
MRERMPQPVALSRIIKQLKREPSRTGSIVITVFGDAIVPRGGSLWLGTRLAFLRQKHCAIRPHVPAGLGFRRGQSLSSS